MFLITTADQRFWKTDDSILFLGEWCKLFSQRRVWEKLDYKVLPYHWDNREKLYHDYLSLDRLIEEVLRQMTVLLNEIHGVDRSLRYWRIIIGPWLNYFIPVVFDRFQSVLAAIGCGRVTNTLICRDDLTKWLPNSFPDFLESYIKDDYNHYLYSRIIEYTEGIPSEITDTEDERKNIKHPNGGCAQTVIKNLVRLTGNLIPNNFNRIVLISTYLNNLDLVKLQLSLKQIPYLSPPNGDMPVFNVDLEKRAQLTLRSLHDDFGQILAKMVMKQFPLNYLEGYSQMHSLALRTYPQNPNVIFTANAYFGNEIFKFWAAHYADQGIKFVGTQHGGLYGAARCYSDEDHELKIYDRYYTWGWKSDTSMNIKPMPSLKLSKIKDNKEEIYPIKNGKILMVMANFPRYHYHMYSIPFAATGMTQYYNFQFAFCKTLPDEIKKRILVRLFGHDYDWSQNERWKHEHPDIECYMGKKTLLKQLKECCLCIVTYNATSLLETFSLNFPTLLLWDPKHWELRPSAQPYYKKLHKAGILYYTPESAAARVSEIYQDPISWWWQSEIQNAKNDFCDQFAKTSGNCLNEWVKEFRNIIPMNEKVDN
jgi:putative transferase (TIGR04331 family)